MVKGAARRPDEMPASLSCLPRFLENPMAAVARAGLSGGWGKEGDKDLGEVEWAAPNSGN